MALGDKIREWRTRGREVREMIGRYVVTTAQTALYKFRSYSKTIDATVPDYEFYDKLRRGKAKGYTLGGLFCRAIETKFSSWVFGDGMTIATQSGDDYTDTVLAEFVAGLLDAGQDDDTNREDYDDESGAVLKTVYEDALGLGDQYIVVNLDGTLSIPSPDTVIVERDDLDYRRMLAVTIETRTEGGLQVVDRYEPARRVVTVKKGNRIESETEFQNLLGRIPVIHISNERSANETNGHPVHEDLLSLLSEYDDVAYKQLDGVKLLGNPILTVEGLEDIEATIEANRPAEYDTYTDKDGNTEDRPQLNVDSNTALLLGKGGSAHFTAPPVGFTDDTTRALRTLFHLLLDRTGIPEFVWGGELTSARATSETQMRQWIKDIQARQRDAGGWIVKLCTIWLQTKALTDPALRPDTLTIEWPDLLPENQEIKLAQLKFTLDNTLMTRETALGLLNLVDDPAAEVARAEGEADARREASFPSEIAFGNEINSQNSQSPNEDTVA